MFGEGGKGRLFAFFFLGGNGWSGNPQFFLEPRGLDHLGHGCLGLLGGRHHGAAGLELVLHLCRWERGKVKKKSKKNLRLRSIYYILSYAVIRCVCVCFFVISFV